MIYLLNIKSNTLIGFFDSIALAKAYLLSIGIATYEDYLFLTKVSDMKYMSRICYVDNICIYNNNKFWLEHAQNIYDNYELHIVKDFLNNVVYKDQFKTEYDNNTTRLGMIHTTADQVNYNMDIGFEFIALFREECVNGDLGSLNGLAIASKTSNVIPLVMTGSFKEGAYVLSTITPDEFLTTELLTKYRNMLLSADVITYQS